MKSAVFWGITRRKPETKTIVQIFDVSLDTNYRVAHLCRSVGPLAVQGQCAEAYTITKGVCSCCVHLRKF
jgi:hypothetical protein